LRVPPPFAGRGRTFPARSLSPARPADAAGSWDALLAETGRLRRS